MQKKTVAILFGGKSSEHDVSLLSATMVINNIPRDKYDVVLIGITKQGRWYLYEGAIEDIASGAWEQGAITPAIISPDSADHGLIISRENGVERLHLDAVFPMLHGRWGEDGTMQGLLELAGIPYVGCDCASSAVCMDKALTNTLLEFAGIPQAAYVWFYSHAWSEDRDSYIAEIEKKLGYPCFVKPANAGSSVGVTKCKSRDDLIGAVALACEHDKKIVVEEGIVGREVECAVFGNENPVASTVGEIVPDAEWYDFDAKYHNDNSKLFIPALLEDETVALIKKRAVEAYKILGCSGLTRMDFFVRQGDGEVMLNEPNTLPGFTPISMYPKLMEHEGVSNCELVDKLIQLAMAR